MPVVEGGELIDQVNESGDLVLGVVAHDLLSGELGGDVVALNLALDKAIKARLQAAVGNGGVVGAPLTIELEVDTSERVIRVVNDGVKILELTAHLLAVGLLDGQWVAERSIVDDVVKTLLVHTTQDVVESTVFQQNPDNVLNLVLQVGNGLLGARGVAKGSLVVASNDGADGAAGETQEGKKSVGLHN